MRMFKIIDLETEETTIIDENILKAQAEYYFNNSDSEEVIDFTNIENCIEFVNRVDVVEEIKGGK